MNLALWRTLRRPPANLPQAVRSAIIYWPGANSEVVRSPRAATEEPGDLVLWGAASHYGDGVVVDAYLSAPANRPPFNRVWTVEMGGRVVSLGLPREIYHLGADNLPVSLVAHYRNPTSLAVCPAQTPGCQGPRVGAGMTALEHHPEWSLVRLDSGPTGWIHQPGLAQISSTAAPFVGGLIAYYRGQFDYAAQQWNEVTERTRAPADLRSDAADLALAARLRAQVEEPPSCTAGIPATDFATRAAVMGWLSEAAGASGPVRQAAVAAAVRCLNRAAALMEPDDPWLRQARAVSAADGRRPTQR